MGKREKGFLMVLIFLGLGALFLGFLKIRAGIYGPFWRSRATPAFKPDLLKQAMALQNKDTDEDGLSDFEETYIYKTSIYLPDTDSDGLTDKEEIEKGNDPLCPKGEECLLSPSQTKESFTDPSPMNLMNENMDDYMSEKTNLAKPDLGKISIEGIRELLIKAGMDKEILDSVDDETLKKVYEETVKEVILQSP